MTTEIERAMRAAARRTRRAGAGPRAGAWWSAPQSEGLLDVAYASVDSPLGPLTVATTPGRPGAGGLRGLPRPRTRCSRTSPRGCRRACSRRRPGSTRVRRELDEYFEGRRTSFDVPIDWSLTRGFTRGVLQATARIPYGEVGTYASVAGAGGQPAGGAGRRQRARREPDAGGGALPPRPADRRRARRLHRRDRAQGVPAAPRGPPALNGLRRGRLQSAASRRGGRVAEGTRLLSEYGGKRSIEGSNPSLSVPVRIAWLCHRPLACRARVAGLFLARRAPPNRRGRKDRPLSALTASAPPMLAIVSTERNSDRSGAAVHPHPRRRASGVPRSSSCSSTSSTSLRLLSCRTTWSRTSAGRAPTGRRSCSWRCTGRGTTPRG